LSSGDLVRRDEMVDQYERLRSDVLSSLAEATRTPGTVLFLRQGMKAWMAAWSSCCPSVPESASTPQRTSTSSPPPESRHAITNILAGMILNLGMEACQ
jgi:hypothetical protein